MANLKTPYESIVCEDRIGLSDKQWYAKRMKDLAAANPGKSVEDVIAMLEAESEISYQDILDMAMKEDVPSAGRDIVKTLMLVIDPQFDFEDNGTLAVPGAAEDFKRLLRFAYKNLDKITQFMISLDTHFFFHVFSGCCWKDKDGNFVKPYTEITKAAYDAGEYYPVMYPDVFRDYLPGLESNSKKKLMIWTLHCLEYTKGWLPEQELVKMMYFHEAARRVRPYGVQKGKSPFSEMYGIFKEEYAKGGASKVNVELTKKIADFDRILIAGQAKSHCVLESLKQFLEVYSDKPEITSKVYFLMDCCSCIPGTEADTEAELNRLQKQYNINLVNSTDLQL